jgi:hypothetical protein
MSHLSFVLMMTVVGGVAGAAPAEPQREAFLQRVDSYVALPHRRLLGTSDRRTSRRGRGAPVEVASRQEWSLSYTFVR